MRRVFALGCVAGYVVVFGFNNIDGLYPAPMTGNTVQLAISFVHLKWTNGFLIGATLGFFFCGGLLSSALRRYVVNPPGELLIMAGVLGAAQAVRSLYTGPVTLELPLLAVAMAMQGETASRFGGRSIQTIVVTNTILKCSDAMVGLLHRARTADGAKLVPWRVALTDAAVPACAWIGYFAGAGASAAASGALRFPLLVPVGVVIAVAADMRASGHSSRPA